MTKSSLPPRPGPTVFVLFGATGDLAARMVLPAFFRLAQENLLPEDWRLVGNGRGDVSHEDFAGHVHDVLEEHGHKPGDGPWEEFSKRLRFAGGGFAKSDPGSLLDVLGEAEKDLGGSPQRVHYFAVPPTAFEGLTEGLAEHGLVERARVVYEKPYGTSMESFHRLDEVVHKAMAEEQVFRIDHFLGKEATQDLHVARFANTLLSSVWSREHVAQVQIDVPETLDIADRAEFYDATGAVLDMLVTHLFQLAAEVAMEAPISLGSDDLQDARETVIDAFRPIDPADVVLGQFEGYADTEGVKEGSRTDTYVAARLWVDTDRWHGVPFLLRTGKQMAQGAQRVSLVLKDAEGPVKGVPSHSGVITFDLAGDGGIEVGLAVKRPGPSGVVESATTKLPLCSVPAADPLPPYARLLNDVLLGDRGLFTRPDGLQHVWEVAEPLLTHLPEPQSYARGSWGPAAAAELARPGRWLLGE